MIETHVYYIILYTFYVYVHEIFHNFFKRKIKGQEKIASIHIRLSPLLHPFIRWNPEECEGITKISVATKNLWLPDIFIVELHVLRAGKRQREAPVSEISRIYSLPLEPLQMVLND